MVLTVMGGVGGRLGGMAALGAMVLAVAACGGGDSDDASGTTVGSTAVPASAVPASTTATTPTSTTGPAAGQLSDADQITTSGLGVVSIGAEAGAAAAAAGATFVPEGDPVGATACQMVRPEPGPAGVAFMVNDGTVARVDVGSGAIATRSGAKIGSTRDEIVGLFGDKIQPEPHPTVAGAEMLVFVPVDPGDANRRVVFETGADGVVVRYWSGRMPEALWFDGCASAV